MTSLLLLAPLFFGFEVWQLVIGERYLGIKQIARQADPRTLGLGEITAFLWTSALVLYWLWMLAILTVPFAMLYGLGLLAVTAIGFALRRNTSIKWVLVILTFEGAIRIGLLVPLIGQAWRRL